MLKFTSCLFIFRIILLYFFISSNDIHTPSFNSLPVYAQVSLYAWKTCLESLYFCVWETLLTLQSELRGFSSVLIIAVLEVLTWLQRWIKSLLSCNSADTIYIYKNYTEPYSTSVFYTPFRLGNQLSVSSTISSYPNNTVVMPRQVLLQDPDNDQNFILLACLIISLLFILSTIYHRFKRRYLKKRRKDPDVEEGIDDHNKRSKQKKLQKANIEAEEERKKQYGRKKMEIGNRQKQEEMERKRKQEMERRRKQEEMERKRKQEMERRRKQEEMEKRRKLIEDVEKCKELGYWKYTDKPKGLPNLGNTCYMNSILQVLSWTPLLGRQLAEQLSKSFKNDNDFNTNNALSRLFLLLWNVHSENGSGMTLDFNIPNHILKEARKLNDQFMGYRQQDSFEMYNTLIGGVEDEARVLPCKHADKMDMTDNEVLMQKSNVSRLLGGTFVTVWYYESCEHVELTFQRFTSVSAPVPKPKPPQTRPCGKSIDAERLDNDNLSQKLSGECKSFEKGSSSTFTDMPMQDKKNKGKKKGNKRKGTDKLKDKNSKKTKIGNEHDMTDLISLTSQKEVTPPLLTGVPSNGNGMAFQDDNTTPKISANGDNNTAGISAKGHNGTQEISANGDSNTARISVNGDNSTADISSNGDNSIAEISAKEHNSTPDISAYGDKNTDGISAKGHNSTPEISVNGDNNTDWTSAKGLNSTLEISAKGHNSTPEISANGDNSTPEISANGDNNTAGISSNGDNSTAGISAKGHNGKPEISANGDNNTADISSNGDNSTPDISAKEHNSTPDISANGDKNTDGISAKGHNSTLEISAKEHNSTPDISANGDNNTDLISVNGDNSKPEISANGDNNTADMSSNGDNNTPEISANGDKNTDGISAKGHNSTLEISAKEHNSTPDISANGDNNTDLISVNGDNSKPEISANGDNNTADMSSNGDNNTPEISANGDNNTAEVSAKGHNSTPEISANGDNNTDWISANGHGSTVEEYTNEHNRTMQDDIKSYENISTASQDDIALSTESGVDLHEMSLISPQNDRKPSDVMACQNSAASPTTTSVPSQEDTYTTFQDGMISLATNEVPLNGNDELAQNDEIQSTMKGKPSRDKHDVISLPDSMSRDHNGNRKVIYDDKDITKNNRPPLQSGVSNGQTVPYELIGNEFRNKIQTPTPNTQIDPLEHENLSQDTRRICTEVEQLPVDVGDRKYSESNEELDYTNQRPYEVDTEFSKEKQQNKILPHQPLEVMREDPTDLERGLFELTEEEIWDEEMIGCRICNSNIHGKQTHKKLLIIGLPPIFVVHINKIEKDGYGGLRKINKTVTYPKYLNVAPFCSSALLKTEAEDAPPHTWFRLYGVVSHGGSIHGGHYTAYVRATPQNASALYSNFLQTEWMDPERVEDDIKKFWQDSAHSHNMSPTQAPQDDGREGWYYVSDSMVQLSDEHAASNDGNAYILMYERCC